MMKKFDMWQGIPKTNMADTFKHIYVLLPNLSLVYQMSVKFDLFL